MPAAERRRNANPPGPIRTGGRVSVWSSQGTLGSRPEPRRERTLARRTPVVLTSFNRPTYTARVLEALAVVQPPILFALVDGPRNDGDREQIEATKALFERLPWKTELIRDFAEENLGVPRRMCSGLDAAFDQFEEVIVFEDDSLPDPSFFPYCEELLERYRDEPRVAQIKGTCFTHAPEQERSYTFTQLASATGWGSWRRVWREFDHSFYDSERAEALRRKPLSRLAQLSRLVREPWPEVDEDPQLRARVERCGQLTSRWMKLVDTQLTSGSWLGALTFHIVRGDSLVASPLRNLVTNTGYNPSATLTTTPNPFGDRPCEPMPFPLHHPPIELDLDAHRREAEERDKAFFGYEFGG